MELWLIKIAVPVLFVLLSFILYDAVFRNRKEKTTKTNDKEMCIIPRCGRETGYRKDTPVNKRNHYVRGAGQLCDKCGNEFLLDEYRKRKNALESAFG
ncbi:MAG: hypothetical protein AAB497_01460 [Patescibacteria group bacterium]